MQIEKNEYIAVTTGLQAQIGIMTRLAKERRETIESLKRELQFRDYILTEVRANAARAEVEHQEALRRDEEAWDYLTHVLNGTAASGPREGDPILYSLAWKVRQELNRLTEKVKQCRGCKRGTRCRK